MPDSAIPGLLQSYLEELVPDRPPELRAMEAMAEAEGFPIIGPACGQVCYLIARMIRARRIFELGSGFGYSTAWFARAVRENAGDNEAHGGELHRAAELVHDGLHGAWPFQIEADADNLNSPGLAFGVQFRQIRQLLAAGSAPGCHGHD